MHCTLFWQLFQEGFRLWKESFILSTLYSRLPIIQQTAHHRKQSFWRIWCLKFIMEIQQSTILSFKHITPHMSTVSSAGLGVSNAELTAEWLTTEPVYIKIWWVMGSKAGWSSTIKSRTTRMRDSNFCVSVAQPALINVSRAHGGPVSASPNMMKQPQRRKRASPSQ